MAIYKNCKWCGRDYDDKFGQAGSYCSRKCYKEHQKEIEENEREEKERQKEPLGLCGSLVIGFIILVIYVLWLQSTQ